MASPTYCQLHCCVYSDGFLWETNVIYLQPEFLEVSLYGMSCYCAAGSVHSGGAVHLGLLVNSTGTCPA